MITSCQNDQKQFEKILLQDSINVDRATGVTLQYSDSAHTRVIVNAPVLLRVRDKQAPKNIFPEGLTADFYNERQQQSSRMTARYGEEHTKEHKVYLRDDVKIWNNKNELLESEELNWDENSKQISSQKYVKITTPTQIIEGVGMKSNLDFTEWEIYNVRGVVESNNVVDVPF